MASNLQIVAVLGSKFI